MRLYLSKLLFAGAAIAAVTIAHPASAADQAVPAASSQAENASPVMQPHAVPVRTSMRRAARRNFVVKRRPAQFAERFMRRAVVARSPRPRVTRAYTARPAVRYAFLDGATRVQHQPVMMLGIGF